MLRWSFLRNADDVVLCAHSKISQTIATIFPPVTISPEFTTQVVNLVVVQHHPGGKLGHPERLSAGYPSP